MKRWLYAHPAVEFALEALAVLVVVLALVAVMLWVIDGFGSAKREPLSAPVTVVR